MSKNINARIALKRDTSANWTNYNPVLLNGELILVDTDNGLRAKIGDGIKTYTQLPFTDEALRALITDVDNSNSAVFVTKNGEEPRFLNTFNIIKLTQEEYEELEASGSLNPDALYLTEGGSENTGGGSKVVMTQDGVEKELPVFNIVKLSEEEYKQLIDSNTFDPDTLYLTEGNGIEGLTEVDEGTPSNIQGLVKGDGSTLQAAQAGVDYQAPLTADVDYATPTAVADKQSKIAAQGLLKGLGDGSVTAAIPGTDYASPAFIRTATLTVEGWTGEAAPFTQTVTVEGILADATKQAILPAPDTASIETWGAVGITCIAQAENALTFSCTTLPDSEITASIVILEVKV